MGKTDKDLLSDVPYPLKGRTVTSDSVLKREAKDVDVKLERVSGLNPVVSSPAGPVYPAFRTTSLFYYLNVINLLVHHNSGN